MATSIAAKPRVIFVLGGPGAGKGTQCERIAHHFSFTHLSAGDCLRAAQQSGSPDGQLIGEYIREGMIVPVEITVKLLREAMERSGNSKFLIDGFPRNLNNLEGWNRVMGDAAEVLFVLFFDCPEAVMEARLMERGRTSGRVDDNIDTIRKRFHTYVDSTRPIIDRFASEGKCRTVVADRSVDEVFDSVKQVLEADGLV